MDVGKCPRGPTNSSAGSLAPGAKADSLLHCIRNSMMVSTLIVLLLSREENLKNEKDMLVEVNPSFFFFGGGGGTQGEASRAEFPSVLQEFF